MKHLIYFTLLLALVARADELLPESTQAEAAPEPKLSEPVPPSEVNPSLALPVESVATVTAVSVSTATEVAAPVAPEEKVAQEPVDTAPMEETAAHIPEESPPKLANEAAASGPVDITAQPPAPPPVAVPPIQYGPSAEEGYGSVGLKNEGQFLEVGGDRKTEESPVEGDRKTSSLPETVSSQ